MTLTSYSCPRLEWQHIGMSYPVQKVSYELGYPTFKIRHPITGRELCELGYAETKAMFDETADISWVHSNYK